MGVRDAGDGKGSRNVTGASQHGLPTSSAPPCVLSHACRYWQALYSATAEHARQLKEQHVELEQRRSFLEQQHGKVRNFF